jgi:hypothetical protein
MPKTLGSVPRTAKTKQKQKHKKPKNKKCSTTKCQTATVLTRPLGFFSRKITVYVTIYPDY